MTVILLTLMPLPQLSARAIFRPLTTPDMRGASRRFKSTDVVADDSDDDDSSGGRNATLPATVTVVALLHASGLGHV